MFEPRLALPVLRLSVYFDSTHEELLSNLNQKNKLRFGNCFLRSSSNSRTGSYLTEVLIHHKQIRELEIYNSYSQESYYAHNGLDMKKLLDDNELQVGVEGNAPLLGFIQNVADHAFVVVGARSVAKLLRARNHNITRITLSQAQIQKEGAQVDSLNYLRHNTALSNINK